MFEPLRSRPERWLFTALIGLLLAPVVVQGAGRTIASLLGEASAAAALSPAAMILALVAWLVGAARAGLHVGVDAVILGASGLGLGLVLGLGVSGLLALALVGAGALVLARWLPERLPPALDGLFPRCRVLALVYAAAALLSVVQVARVSVFMGDPTRSDAQLIPDNEFLGRHSCLSAYVRAGELARERVDNLYLHERWPIAVMAEERPETRFSPFDLVAFFYPPPFLLVSEVLTPLSGDFLAQRAAWFALNGLLVAFGFWIGARAFGGARWHRPLLLAPILFGSIPMLVIFQVGQAQAAVVIVSILAMLAFELRRPALGGFALALTIAAKISPGLFGIVLLVQRRWRDAAWTAAFGALLLLLSLVAYGSDPIVSWLTYTLPRLSSGEAFAEIFKHGESVALNLAPAGMPFKLELLGVDFDDPWAIARRVNQAFTLIVVGLAVVVGLRHRAEAGEPRTSRALAWMALLFFASLRSPFAPSYVAFALLWAMTVASVEVESWRGGVGLFVLALALSIAPPLDPAGLAVYVMVVEGAVLVFALALILRGAASPGRGSAGSPATRGRSS